MYLYKNQKKKFDAKIVQEMLVKMIVSMKMTPSVKWWVCVYGGRGGGGETNEIVE